MMGQEISAAKTHDINDSKSSQRREVRFEMGEGGMNVVHPNVCHSHRHFSARECWGHELPMRLRLHQC